MTGEPREPESDDPFRQAIDALPVLVWLTDERLRIVEQRGGAPSAHLTPVGSLLREHWGPDDPAGAVAEHERALDGTSVQSEAVVAGRTLSFRLEPRRIDGRIVGVVGVGLDVTSERALQADLARAERLEAIGTFTGGIAHDFNNMLLAIIGNLELALAPRVPDGSAPRRHIGTALEAAHRSAELVRQLLAYSRKQVLQPRALDLNAEIRGVVRFLSAGLGEQTELRLDLEPSIPTAHVDPSQFEQVVVNLVVNARDAMAGDGAITISTRVIEVTEARPVLSGTLDEGRWVEMVVSDHGQGIEPDALPTIFEPFYTTKEVGTGLGLSTVFGIVVQSGGQIDVESQLTAGTAVHTFFPVRP